MSNMKMAALNLIYDFEEDVLLLPCVLFLLSVDVQKIPMRGFTEIGR
jgi:hypothetical protein